MSFFFNRGRNRTNAAELARQTYDLLARLDVANNPNPKVGSYRFRLALSWGSLSGRGPMC